MRNEDVDEMDERVRKALACVADVLDLRPLSDAERAHIEHLEETAEAGGAAGGMVEFVNEGVRGALACGVVYAATTGPMLDDPAHPWMVMLDSDDRLIGEWLPESRRNEVRESDTAIFLSPDFVLYKDRRAKGKSRFVMPFVCVPLEDVAGGLSTCGIGTPSGPADEYIRSLMGNPDKETATLVVGIAPIPPDAQDKQGATT
ncbi:MAG: hypothetical protein ACYC33_11425 [Thermoleophilia bacterium]